MSQNLVFGPYFYENAKKNMLEHLSKFIKPKRF